MPYVAYNREVADFLKAVYCAELGNDTLEWLGAERILIADDFNNDLSYYLPGTTLYFYILGEPLHCLPKKKFSGNSIKEFR